MSPKLLAILFVAVIASATPASAGTYTLQCGQTSNPNSITLTINTDSQTVTAYTARLGRSQQYSTTAFTDSRINWQETEPNGQVVYASLDRQSGALTFTLGSATVGVTCK